jgi:hypothetical protein
MKCKYHLCNNDVHAKTKKQRVFCSRNCNLKYRVRKWRIELKKKAVEYKGGKCSRCGYDRCVWALDFHHKNKQEKIFNISKSGNTRSWERVQNELDKCDLVCSNCHRELEHEECYSKAS